MFYIILMNAGFWLNLIIPFAILLYLALTNKEYIWKEFLIQLGITLVYVFGVFYFMFSFTTDLVDEEYWNSKVKSFTFMEEWNEEVTYSCGTSKKPKTCTRIDHHSPFWEIRSTLNETIRIPESKYKEAKRDFGDKEVNIFRSNQVSWGDGDKYVSYPNIVIPMAIAHNYDNYVKAVKSNLLHTRVPKADIDIGVKNGFLRNYPTTYNGKYNSKQLNRIIDTTGLNKSKTKNLSYFNLKAVDIGTYRQANPIIYITKEGQNFKYLLEQYWSKGKKNDITLILGINDRGEVLWSNIIAYNNNTDFEIESQNIYKGMFVSDLKPIINKLYKSIISDYVRKPMSDFEYLRDNIEIEWYWHVLILLLNIVISSFITYQFLNNYERRY